MRFGWKKVKDFADTRIAVVSSGLLLAVSVLGFAAVVSGHEKNSEWNKFASFNPGTGEVCGKGQARVADGNFDNGFTRATTRSARLEGLGGDCDFPAGKEPGKMKVRWIYLHKNNDHGWQVCRDIEAQFNQQVTAEMTRYRDWEHKPCGQGTYRTDGKHGVFMQGDMEDGPTESPDHFFGD